MAVGNRSSYTTAREKVSLFAATKHQLLSRGQPGEIREFTAIALTDGIPLSKSGLHEYAGRTSGAPVNDSIIARFILKAMIVGDANGDELRPINNPHRFLLNPCALGDTADVNLALRITKLYTTYITSSDFNESGGNIIRKNDKIKVTMVYDREGRIIMEQGKIVALVETAEENIALKNACVSLSGVFQSNTVTSLGAPTATPGAGYDEDYTALDATICDGSKTEFYLTHPLQSAANITSPYGAMRDMSEDGVDNPTKHTGMDIGAATGTPLYAAAAGTVSLSPDQGGSGGNILTIDHGEVEGKSYKTMSMHLHSFSVANGSAVEVGDLVGVTGATGEITGPHLHFVLLVNGAKTDPNSYIKTIEKCG